MFSRKSIRLTVFATVVTTLGVYAYLAPASTVVPAPHVDGALVGERPGIANSAIIRRSSEGLSVDAVDSGGIEKDLDGNASALVPSDQLR